MNPITHAGAMRRPVLGLCAVLLLSIAACGDADSRNEADAQSSESTTVTSEPPENNTGDNQPTNDAPVETAAGGSGEFIELQYWEGVLSEGFTRTQQPDEECDVNDRVLFVCDWEMSFESITTHLGHAQDHSTGTTTRHLDQECELPDGSVDHVVSEQGEGTITAAFGDELHFRLDFETCGQPYAYPGYWEVVGGTGRFEDAYGVMSSALVPEPEYLSIAVGTLHVRADLWNAQNLWSQFPAGAIPTEE